MLYVNGDLQGLLRLTTAVIVRFGRSSMRKRPRIEPNECNPAVLVDTPHTYSDVLLSNHDGGTNWAVRLR